MDTASVTPPVAGADHTNPYLDHQQNFDEARCVSDVCCGSHLLTTITAIGLATCRGRRYIIGMLFRLSQRVLLLMLMYIALLPGAAKADYIWIEGEHPSHAQVTRHPWWYDKVRKDQLSGGDLISNWDPAHAGELIYTFDSPTAGDFDFWLRANPVQTSLKYRLNGSPWSSIDMTNPLDNVNIAENNALDVRFIAWLTVGTVPLKRGSNTVMFRMDSKNNNCGMIDCFVFSTTPFSPHGTLKPDQLLKTNTDDQGWIPFSPGPDPYTDSALDLRSLNEKTAGDGGFIAVKDGEFIHSRTGDAVCFWGVNGPPADLNDLQQLRSLAKLLAKRGVNLVRIHAPYFDESGAVDPKKVQHAIDIVNAMKAEGIYCHFSIYYYAWFHPKPKTPWLDGYDGAKTPVGAIFINPQFQEQYRKWWSALLCTPDLHSGRRLIDEPAVASVELVNEDSLLFWTFNRDTIPASEWELIENQFSRWALRKYGSAEAIAAAWNQVGDERDAAALGRFGIRPLWQMIKERTRRDQDTAQFLADTERSFYVSTIDYLHHLGFKGLITPSNWTTASPALELLEKQVYTVGDFTDRHGYVSPDATGDSADWSIRDGQTYLDRSALHFDPHEPGQPRPLFSPVMDPHFAGNPSMLSEVAISRPDRYRSEAPIYFAAYGSVQGSNAIEHFALDGPAWSVKPNFFMQPWTVMSPATMGQFPAAAVIYRQRLIAPCDSANINVAPATLWDWQNPPALGLLSGLSETQLPASGAIDPLVCFEGRTSIYFAKSAATWSANESINRAHRTVSSVNHQLQLDYQNGVLRLNAPCVQGISGNLAAAGPFRGKDVTITSPLDLAHIVLVSLDGQPLATSKRMLLQAMSEERPSNFQTVDIGGGRKQIVNIGNDPWLIKQLAGTVALQRSDAAQLHVVPLDANGYAIKSGKVQSASKVNLEPDVIYYSIAP